MKSIIEFKRNQKLEWTDVIIENLDSFLSQAINSKLIVSKTVKIFKQKLEIGKRKFWNCSFPECNYMLKEILIENQKSFQHVGVHIHNLPEECKKISTRMIKLEILEHKEKKPKELYKILIDKHKDLISLNTNEKSNLLKWITNQRYLINKPNHCEVVKSNFDIDHFYETFSLSNALLKLNFSDFFVGDSLRGIGTTEDPFLVTFSSLTCFDYLKQQIRINKKGILVIDGTFKISKLKYPLITITTQDQNHHIYPIMFALTSELETKSSINFILNCLTNSYLNIFNEKLNISYVVSDGNINFYNAVVR